MISLSHTHPSLYTCHLFINSSINRIHFLSSRLSWHERENYIHSLMLRAGLDYGQTSRGKAFGPMKMQKCPKSVLWAFTLEAKVQRTLPPKEPRWQHFYEVRLPRVRPLKQSLGQAKCPTQTSVKRPNFFFIKIFKI